MRIRLCPQDKMPLKVMSSTHPNIRHPITKNVITTKRIGLWYFTWLAIIEIGALSSVANNKGNIQKVASTHSFSSKVKKKGVIYTISSAPAKFLVRTFLNDGISLTKLGCKNSHQN